MTAPRKVNAPVSSRRLRTPKGPHRLESATPDSGVRSYLVLASGISAVLALAVGLAWVLPRWWPQTPPPWETYRERMVIDPDQSREAGRQIFVYRYLPSEVDLWIGGIRSPGLAREELRTVVDQAVELLHPADAARVLLAAAQARPEFAPDWIPAITTVQEGLTISVPEERALRAGLQSLTLPRPDPAPAP